jgi:xylulokinase
MIEDRPYVLAIDVGTSALKAVVYSEAGSVLVSASRHYETLAQVEQPGWVEANPNDWWEALVQAIEAVKESLPSFSQIQAIALTGQMHTTVLLDERGDVLPPTILWLDRRATSETVELQQAFGMPAYQLNSTYSLPKLLWLSRHQPEVIQKARHLQWPKDYLRFKLTGEWRTDYTEAGGAALLDWQRLDWATERLEWAGISPAILPPLRQPTDLAGKLKPEITQKWGLDPEIKILTGVGDVLALVTAAPRAMGRVFCSMGSSSMVYYPLEAGSECQDARDRIYIYPLLPYRLLGGVSSTSGASISWAAKTLFHEQSFEAAVTEALEIEAGAEGLLFLPFLSGERSPFWSDNIRGGFYGLSLQHDRKVMLRAVMEGVAFSLRYLLDIFEENGVSIREIALAGGGAAIQGLPAILANICQRPIIIFSGQETVTRGLYAYACQVLERDLSFETALGRTFKEQSIRIEPDHKSDRIYRRLYQQYQHLADFADDILSKI